MNNEYIIAPKEQLTDVADAIRAQIGGAINPSRIRQ